MKRKVNMVGTGTLTISLPTKWVKDNGIKKGDEIELIEEGSNLRIVNGEGIGHNIGRVKLVPGTVGFLKSIISNAYKKGYDKIRIEFEDKNLMPLIIEVVDTLMGFEIIEEGDNYCIAENVAKGIETQYEPLLKKSFKMTFDNGLLVYEQLKAGKFDYDLKIDSSRKTITKFADFCKRIININMKNSEIITFHYTLVWSIEKISNEFDYVQKYCSKVNLAKVSPEILLFFKQTLDQLEMFQEAFYTKNFTKISQLVAKKDKLLFTEAPRIYNKIKNDEGMVLYHLCSVVRRIHDMTGGPFFGIYA